MTKRTFLPLSRRTFVKLAAVTAASHVFSGCDSGVDAEQVENLIIGSGFGGSITALRLAEAGFSSVVLERGQRWTPTPDGQHVFSNMGFTRADGFDDRYDKRSTWLSTRQPLPGLPPRQLPIYAGVLERVFGDGIDVVCPAGVGGGSLVYSGMMVRPPRELFESVFPRELTAELMNPYYDRVQQIMQPSPIPDSLLELPPWLAQRVFIEQAMRAGVEVERIPCAFDWERAMLEVTGELPPQLIRGHYIFGLDSGAKRSLDRLYLGMAEETGRCEVRPLHWVERIVKDGARYRVEVHLIDEEGMQLESRVISARRLFLCAGTMNTNALLLRAREEGTIGDLPEMLGEGFGNNGQHIMAREGVGVDTGAFQAGPACLMMFDSSAPIAMENGPAPLGMERQALIGTGQGVPSGRGRIVWRDGKAIPEWDEAYDAEAKEHARVLVDRLNAANAGTNATTALGLDQSVTFHPLGGCVMGETTDLYGRIPRHEGLYVIDGSLIPGVTPMSNPCWTISANVERCIERILAEDFMGEGV